MQHLFNFETHEVSTIVKNEEVWFVASDIAQILGYRNAPDMVRILDEDEKGTHIMRTLGGDQEVTIINEPAIYKICFRSEKAEAKALTRWVTHEVLPAIRKQGYYISEAKVKELEQELTRTRSRLNAVVEVKDIHKDYLNLILKQEDRDGNVRAYKLMVEIHEQYVKRVKTLLTQGVKGKDLLEELQNLSRWHDKTWHALFVRPGDAVANTYYPDMNY